LFVARRNSQPAAPLLLSRRFAVFCARFLVHASFSSFCCLILFVGCIPNLGCSRRSHRPSCVVLATELLSLLRQIFRDIFSACGFSLQGRKNPNQHQGGAQGGCMQLHTHLRKSSFVRAMFGKAALATAALGGLLFFAGAPGTQAADRDDCQRRIAKTERKLNDAIEDHGYYSRQADHWRHERREAVERCYGREYRNNWDRDRDRY
jgi:hypothetical protein